MKQIQRTLAAVLTAALILSLLPLAAFAQEETDLLEEAIAAPEETAAWDDDSVPLQTDLQPELPSDGEDLPAAEEELTLPEEEPAVPEEPSLPEEQPLPEEEPLPEELPQPQEVAPAGEEEAVQAPDEAQSVLTDEDSLEDVTLSFGTRADPEELAEGYALQQLGLDGAKTSQTGRIRKNYSVSFTDTERKIYNTLKTGVTQIASGKRVSADFEFDFSQYSYRWTSKELGIPIVTDGTLTAEAKNAAQNHLIQSIRKMLDLLLAECPYELYWYDKTEGLSLDGTTIGYSGKSTYIAISSGTLALHFTVAREYAAGEYEVDPATGTAVRTAVDNASRIVVQYASDSDYDKLHGYKAELCNMISYNYDALEPGVAYGNPWQIIWALDGDPSTNVVCEGYAKAFQYLCDHSHFEENIVCYSMTGEMTSGSGGGGHMWNTVSMGNGRNYLVDVTNCDSGIGGGSDRLFMVGYTSGSVEEGYSFLLGYTPILYQYDDETCAIFSTQELTLSPSTYHPVTKVEGRPRTCTEDGNLAYWVCSDCGLLFSDALCDHQIQLSDTFLPRTGHSMTQVEAKTATCTEPGVRDCWECGNCGKRFVDPAGEQELTPEEAYVPALGHDWGEWEVVTPAGFGAAGELRRTCGNDASHTQTEIIPQVTVTLSEQKFTYDGTPKQPAVTVTSGDAVLAEGTDYQVAIQSRTDAGKGTVTITLMGEKYSGTRELSFTVDKADQTLVVSAGKTSLTVGTTTDITATGIGDLNFRSDKAAVATVSSTGVITAKAPGSATITVTAAGDNNHKPASATISVSVACAKPAIKKAENVDGGVKITWGEVAGAVQYRVFRKTGSGGWQKLGDTTALSFTDKTAVSGTQYSYTVRCVTADGNSYTSGYDSAGKTVTYLSAPVLNGVSNVAGGVKITWGKVSGAVKYRVFRKSGTGGWQKLGDTTALNFTDKTAASGVTYTYTVRCVTKDGSSYTSGYNAAGKTVTYLSAPVLNGVSNAAGGVKITWGKVTGAVKYRVFRKSGSGGWQKLGDTTALNFTDKTAVSGVTYTYTVRCVTKDGSGYTSGYDDTGKTITFVAVPSISSVTNSSGRKMTARWKKDTAVSGYQIQYSTSSTFASGNQTVTVKGSGTVSKTIDSLTKGKTYYVRLRSYCTVNGKNVYSAWSGANSIKISK